MAPDEHDNPQTPGERATTEFFRFTTSQARRASAAGPQFPDWQSPEADSTEPAVGETVADLPVMEPLPEGSALPDPGYPVMPPSPPLAQPFWPQPAAPPESAAAPSATVQPGPASAPPRPSPPPSPLAGPVTQPWSPDPYAAPRAPAAAPPLHGPSVPWSEVRAGVEHRGAEQRPAGGPLGTPSSAPPAPPAPPAPAAGQPGEHAEAPGARHGADALTSDTLLQGKRITPDGGWRRTLYRATGGLVRVGESAASTRRRDLVNRVRTPVAGGHHRVAVLSLKGGVGKTTATVGLGSTLASLRGDRVIAVDGNPDRGTLSDKVRLETSATVRDLLNERAMVTRYADVRAFTSQAPSRLEILASDRDPGVSVAFSADDYRAVAGVLEHYYSICVTDCGTGLLHSAMAGILELADQIVLVSSPSVDGARSASATLDWLEAHGYGDLVRGGVVVLSAVRRKSKSTVDIDRLEQHFAARCRAVVRIPYDPHLEEGAEVELDMLNPETADAYLQLAAHVADGFARPRRSVSGTTQGSPFA